MTRLSREQHLREVRRQQITRRWFFKECGLGLGAVALGSLLGETVGAAPADALSPKLAHLAPKAKRVIYLFMAGAPSQFELYDYKPTLQKYDNQPMPTTEAHRPIQLAMRSGRSEKVTKMLIVWVSSLRKL